MDIHPTAIIAPQAELAADVEIGPYAVIEGRAIIGPGCVIQAHAVLSGNVRLGRGNVIGYGAVLGAAPQDLAFKPGTRSEVILGDWNVVREYATIHRGTAEGTATTVGDRNFLMGGCHLAHNVRIGDRVIMANNSLLAGYVEVEDGVFISGACVFHQFVRIGRMAMIQGQSGFGKDVPPFTIGAEHNTVAGLNTVGLRRAGFTSEQRQELKAAFKLLYKSGLNVSQALEKARALPLGPEARAFFDFVEAAKRRGICDLREGGGGREAEADGAPGGGD